MNLVGKIFVALIMVMSIAFAMLAVSVYMTHVNWYERVTAEKAEKGKPVGLKKQLEEAVDKQRKLVERIDELDKQYKTQETIKKQQLAKSETEKLKLQADRDEAEKKFAALNATHQDQLVKVQAEQAKFNALRLRVDEMQKEIIAARQKIDEEFGKVVVQTEKNHELANRTRLLQERYDQLVDTIKHHKQVALAAGIDLEGPVRTDKAGLVNGVVKRVQIVERNTLVELSIGSDDGLQVGHSLEVFRGDNYLGRVTVIRTFPDKAGARLDPITGKGQIQVGDRVESRLSLQRTAGL